MVTGDRQGQGWRRARVLAAGVVAAVLAAGVGAVATPAVASATLVAGTFQQTGAFPRTIGSVTDVSCATATTCEAVGVFGADIFFVNGSGPGAVLGTTDGGATWTPQALPAGVPLLSSITCPSTTTCLAAGTSVDSATTTSAVVGTTDGGTTWVNLPLPTGATSLSTVDCGSPSTCVVLGATSSGAGAWATTDGGQQWTTATVPSGVTSLAGVSCPTSTTCVAVGATGSGPTVVTTTDSGASWTKQTMLAGIPAGAALAAVACTSASTCTVGGSVFDPSTGVGTPVLDATSDGGADWTSEPVPAGVTGVTGLSCPSATVCQAVGTSSRSGSNLIEPAVLGTSDGGATWATETLPVSMGTSITVSCGGVGTCELAGVDNGVSPGWGVLLGTADDGATWATQPMPVGVDGLRAVSCASATACTAIGYTGNDGATSVVASSDGGETWQWVAAIPNATLTGLSCPSASVCEAVGLVNSRPGIYRTTDGGTTWSAQPVPAGMTSLSGVSCASTSVCEAVGSGSADVIGTTDGGATWSAQPVPAGLNGLTGVSCASVAVCEAVGYGGSADVIGTTDGGATWTSQTVPTGVNQLDAVACGAPSDCEAVGTTSAGSLAVVTTTDGGATWAASATPPVADNAGHLTVACTTVATCDVAGEAGPSSATPFVASTSDAGATWSSVPLPSGVSAVAGLAAAGSVFVGAADGAGSNTADNGTDSTGAILLRSGTPAPPPPPTTTVGLPASGSSLTGSVWLDASAESPGGVASVTYQLTGGSLTAPKTVAIGTPTVDGFLAAWGTTDVPNGTYQLRSVATGLDGVVATSAPVSVAVANAPLHVTVLVPSSGAVVSGSRVVLDASANGRSPVTALTFSLSGGSLASPEQVGTATLTLYGWIALWDASGTPAGTYTLTATATDAAGHTATSTGVTLTVG